jgi:hypothetical protein
MTLYGVGAVAVAAAVGFATVMPIWVALTFIGLCVLVITGILRAVGGPARVPTQAALPIPLQRGGERLARPVE